MTRYGLCALAQRCRGSWVGASHLMRCTAQFALSDRLHLTAASHSWPVSIFKALRAVSDIWVCVWQRSKSPDCRRFTATAPQSTGHVGL